MRGLAAALLLAAAPAGAQPAPMPPFDAAKLETCLAEASRKTPDWRNLDHIACIGASAGPCIESPAGGSTYGTSYCLGRELEIWDKKLNDSYARVLAAAKATDAEMTALGSAVEQQEPLLQQMQRDWVAFRDAACAFERSRWGGGTGGGPASVDCSLQLTAQQYLRLRAYQVK